MYTNAKSDPAHNHGSVTHTSVTTGMPINAWTLQGLPSQQPVGVMSITQKAGLCITMVMPIIIKQSLVPLWRCLINTMFMNGISIRPMMTVIVIMSAVQICPLQVFKGYGVDYSANMV